VFRIPQIGYSSTTTELSDNKEQFGYFMRVVPSDAWQAMAINQLLMHFNWTYIAVVYSSGSIINGIINYIINGIINYNYMYKLLIIFFLFS
jgi:ABC-type branched-subunit amino acid transport system substrate-binding protein